MRAAWTPSIVCGALILLCGAELWQVGRFRAEHEKFAAELSALRDSVLAAVSADQAAALDRRIAEATDALTRETARRTVAETSVKAAEAAIPGAKDEELRSAGHIEKFALGAAEWIESFVAADSALHGSKGATAAEQEKALEFLKTMMEWVPKLTLVGEMEDTPADVAKLHASTITKRLDLDGASLAAIRDQIQREFTDLATAGLTRSHCPEVDAKEWRARRTSAIAEAAKRVEALLPPARLKSNVVAQSLSLGDAYFSQVQTLPDGRGSVNFGVRLPGLSWRF